MGFNFQLCQDRSIDNRLRGILSDTFNLFRSEVEALSPRSVILTGSLARGEGSVVSNNGVLRLNSDIEALIIFKNHQDFLQVSLATKRLEEDITRYLKGQNVFCKVELAPTSADSFLKFKPTIFVYELNTMGKVVWGDGSVLSLIRPFSAQDIPRWDAFDLMNNRIIEHLVTFKEALNGQSATPGKQEVAAYSLIKMYMDMATAILVFVGQYEPTYEARAKRFRGIGPHLQGTPLQTCMPYLAEKIDRCTHFKLHQEGSALDFLKREVGDGNYEPDDRASSDNQVLLREWEKLSLYVRPVWVWMANEIAGGESTGDVYTLVNRILKKEPLFDRFKGWAKLGLGLKRANRLKELQYRRLLNGLTTAGPVTIIRCLGALLYLYVHDLRGACHTNGQILSYIEGMLPSTANDSPKKLDPDRLIKEIGYNYMKFARFNYDLRPVDN